MQIDEELLGIIRSVIDKGARVEIVPAKDGVEVYVAKRKKYKPEVGGNGVNGP